MLTAEENELVCRVGPGTNTTLIGNRVQFVGPTLNLWNIEQWTMR